MGWAEGFFGGLYGEVLAHQFDEAASEQDAKLVKKLLRLRKGRRALDVPCGMGRLALPLARTGVKVTGVDFTASFIRKARAQAKTEGLDAEFLVGDMRRMDFESEFDGAFNWFTSIGYGTDADDLAFCRCVLRALKPGGRFVIETMNKSWLLSHLRAEPVTRKIGPVEVHDRTAWDPRTGRICSRWRLGKGKQAEQHRVCIRQFNGADIRRLLRDAGFAEVKLFGRPLGPFTRHSKRLIAVARKRRRRRRNSGWNHR